MKDGTQLAASQPARAHRDEVAGRQPAHLFGWQRRQTQLGPILQPLGHGAHLSW